MQIKGRPIGPSRLFHFRVIVAVMIRILGQYAGHAAAFVFVKVELEVNSDAIELGLRKRAKLVRSSCEARAKLVSVLCSRACLSRR